MGQKTLRSNFRVEVTPRNPGDFGIFSISGRTQSEDEWQRDCEDIAAQIRRHVDGVGGVYVYWDTENICEHCGCGWDDPESPHNGCCAKDEENMTEETA